MVMVVLLLSETSLPVGRGVGALVGGMTAESEETGESGGGCLFTFLLLLLLPADGPIYPELTLAIISMFLVSAIKLTPENSRLPSLKLAECVLFMTCYPSITWFVLG